VTVIITPSKLSGAITPPPSKSQAHRYLMAAALAGEGSKVHNLADSQDILATRRCLEELGPWVGPHSPDRRLPLPLLDCGESGSTLRFLIPVALALRGGARFTGHGRLMDRPQKPYFDIFEEKGIFYEQKDGVLTVQGRLTPGVYSLPGDVSSQFVTGLLYALPLLEGDSEIVLTSPLESRGYVDMTLQALRAFGVQARETEKGYHIPGRQSYHPNEVTVEADWSQAGFWYAAKGLGNPVELTGLDPNSAQGDKVAAENYEKLCQPGEVTLDVSQCPDLVPALAAHAALRGAAAVTYMVNAARLRIKESDRLSAVREELSKLGAQVEEGPDSLTVTGVDGLTGGRVDSHNDHRIAMMLAVAATRAAGPVTLTGAQAVNKSYPNFWEDYQKLGGKIQMIP
jgi:3-phosphoshikimate 1-carboxyvinyltransferase